jgi:hypothetical protein
LIDKRMEFIATFLLSIGGVSCSQLNKTEQHWDKFNRPVFILNLKTKFTNEHLIFPSKGDRTMNKDSYSLNLTSEEFYVLSNDVTPMVSPTVTAAKLKSIKAIDYRNDDSAKAYQSNDAIPQEIDEATYLTESKHQIESLIPPEGQEIDVQSIDVNIALRTSYNLHNFLLTHETEHQLHKTLLQFNKEAVKNAQESAHFPTLNRLAEQLTITVEELLSLLKRNPYNPLFEKKNSKTVGSSTSTTASGSGGSNNSSSLKGKWLTLFLLRQFLTSYCRYNCSHRN